MKEIKKHPMLDKQYDIHFIHIGNDKYDKYKNQELVLSAGINPLTNGWMYWWDVEPNMFAPKSKKDLMSIVKGIRKKAKVLKDTFPK